MAQHDFGGVYVGLNGSDRAFDDQLHAHGGGQMHHHVGAIDRLGGEALVHYGIDRVGKALAAFEVLDVFNRAGREIVEDLHVVAIVEEFFREVPSDETCTPGDEDPHALPSLVARTTLLFVSVFESTCSKTISAARVAP